LPEKEKNMSIPFNAEEIFEMAEEIERNGAKFYRDAAKKFTRFAKMLKDLAEMEDQHLKTFAAMKDELSEAEKESPVFDPDDQVQMYLRVMADGHVFDVRTDPSKLLSTVDTPEDMLKMAIGFEKDSVAFYTGLRESVSHSAGKAKIQAIIKEELNHIVILSHLCYGI
jgi:rubrerythrin